MAVWDVCICCGRASFDPKDVTFFKWDDSVTPIMDGLVCEECREELHCELSEQLQTQHCVLEKEQFPFDFYLGDPSQMGRDGEWFTQEEAFHPIHDEEEHQEFIKHYGIGKLRASYNVE